ncbi:MAG: aldolase [Terracidiphilus sp.]
MMTIEEIESACDASRPLDFSRHDVEAPELSHGEVFYPLGFPTELRTNSPEILSQARSMWPTFDKRFETELIRIDVHVVESDSMECPPTPVCRIMYPLVVSVADKDNYSIVHLDRNRTQITISRATEKHRTYLAYFFLGYAPHSHIEFRYLTPVHAGCVALNERGVLLCGDSGAGKSSMSYACARAGWTYVSDDASSLINDSKDRQVIGNCSQVRFRPSAAELFPELNGLEITPRAAGKPSVELPTAQLAWMTCAPAAQVDFLVFLNRRVPGSPELVPYRKEVARYFMRQVLFGPVESLAAKYAALERLLTAEVFELRYSDLDWAVRRLEMLVREGR